jgi:exodeoxyribonuclease V gamma subunit
LPQGIARLRFGKPNGPSSIRHGLDWLLATAAGVNLPFVEFHEDPDIGVGPHVRPPLSREVAIDALHALVALRRDGLRRPLPFAPYSAWELFTAATPERGLQKASDRWRGNQGSWAEGDSEALRLALRGRDPFADAAAVEEFAEIAFVIYGAVTRGEPMPAPTINAGALPDDTEDEA